MIELDKKPFNLDSDGQAWVKRTFAEMTEDEKIGQVLCPQLSTFDKGSVSCFVSEIKAGAVMIRPFEKDGLKDKIAAMQAKSKIPMLVAANLENGGNGATLEGTLFANPMGCAATGDKINGYRLGKIACNEAAEVGVNWAFAPIVDIDNNYHNPITNVRTFGSDYKTVLSFAEEYIKAATDEGVVPTIKHFPGDGMDERDQHLLVSVNDCSAESWKKTYGKVYKTLIDEGARAVMCGHIAAPMVAKAISPDISDEESLLPATQSRTLLDGLLRKRLGFNGVIITDSSLMVGYMQSMPRHKAVPYSIECGADMILFNRSVKEDFIFLKEGLKSGILSSKRLDEAVIRILALKASLKLYDAQKSCCIPLSDGVKKEWAKECADNAVTLVKDNKKLLPLTPEKYRRIYLNVIENVADNSSPFAQNMAERFKKEGFEVTLRKRRYNFDPAQLTLETITPEVDEALKEVMCDTASFVSKYDMAVIILNIRTASNATVLRVNWNVLFGMGNDIPWYSGEMPLVAISFSNPYHLLDIPMAHAYVNAYTETAATIDAVFDKITGRSPFKGTSPVDPFCGKKDTKI